MVDEKHQSGNVVASDHSRADKALYVSFIKAQCHFISTYRRCTKATVPSDGCEHKDLPRQEPAGETSAAPDGLFNRQTIHRRHSPTDQVFRKGILGLLIFFHQRAIHRHQHQRPMTSAPQSNRVDFAETVDIGTTGSLVRHPNSPTTATASDCFVEVCCSSIISLRERIDFTDRQHTDSGNRCAFCHW